jgi:hypothetical protein
MGDALDNFLTPERIPRPRSRVQLEQQLQQQLGAAYVAPVAKKKRARPEDALHLAVRGYLEAVIAPPGRISRDRVMWWTNENRNVGREIETSNGRRVNPTAIANKRRGAVAGVPDIQIQWPGGTLFVELKAPNGVLSAEQARMHPELRQTGAGVVVARSVDQVAAALEAWRVPCRERRR